MKNQLWQKENSDKRFVHVFLSFYNTFAIGLRPNIEGGVYILQLSMHCIWGKPNLYIIEKEDLIKFILTAYKGEIPDPNKLLFLDTNTSMEDIEIFINRCLNDARNNKIKPFILIQPENCNNNKKKTFLFSFPPQSRERQFSVD